MCTCRYHLQDAASEEARAPLITHARHRSHLESALGFLDAFLETSGTLRFLNPFDLIRLTDIPVVGVEDVVLGAEELRYAAQAVGKISGLVDVEDVLDVIFSQFCIGK
jgi:tRNA modification GTPase